MTAGRKTVLTPAVHETIVRLVNAGVPIKRAAMSQGVSARAVMNWMARGRASDPEAPDEPYATFAQEVDAARGVYLSGLVMRVGKASDKDWRAAAWMLERQFKEFSERKIHEMDQQPQSGADNIDVSVLDDQERAVFRKLLGKMVQSKQLVADLDEENHDE